MLSIDFLKKDIPLDIKLAGMEYMDAVRNRNVYETLTKYVDEHIVRKEVVPGITEEVFDWDRADKDAFAELIMRETGIGVTIVDGNEYTPFAIETGFLSPNHILNNKGIDQLLESKYSSVSQAMKVLNTDVLKGWVEPKTGRVGGDFSKIKFNLHIGWIPAAILDTKVLKKHNVSVAQASAIAILHELGHAFSAFYFLARQTVDLAMVSITSRMIANAEVGTRKIALYKEFAKELEVVEKVKDQDIERLETEDDVCLFLNKMVTNRNIRSTLSLGIADRASEVYADIYAMKMGCPEALISLFASIYSTKPNRILYSALMFSPFYLFPMFGITAGLIVPSLMVFGLMFFFADVFTIAPNEVYDSPYRRSKAILREYAGEISAAKGLSSAEKADMLKRAKKMEEMVNEMKDSLEGTWFQRMSGWIASGSEFKYSDFDHYTQEILNHNLSLYTEYFKKD